MNDFTKLHYHEYVKLSDINEKNVNPYQEGYLFERILEDKCYSATEAFELVKQAVLDEIKYLKNQEYKKHIHVWNKNEKEKDEYLKPTIEYAEKEQRMYENILEAIETENKKGRIIEYFQFVDDEVNRISDEKMESSHGEDWNP